jgi:hypothetical protein
MNFLMEGIPVAPPRSGPGEMSSLDQAAAPRLIEQSVPFVLWFPMSNSVFFDRFFLYFCPRRDDEFYDWYDRRVAASVQTSYGIAPDK